MFDTWKKLHTLCHVAAQDHKQYILEVAQTLQEGHDINATTWDKKTALHLSLMDPSYKSAHVVASLLIDHGCNIHLKDNEGQTALHYAARNGHLSIIKKLLENQEYQVFHGKTTITVRIADFPQFFNFARGWPKN